MPTSQIIWIAGLVACVCGALLGQAELVGEPWRHILTVGFILGTAVSGYMVEHPLPSKASNNEP